MTAEANDASRGSFRKVLETWFARFVTFILTVLSIYIVWGWITIEDVHKYCASNGLDFEKTLTALVPSETVGEMTVSKEGVKVKDFHSGSSLPVYRYLMPFNAMGSNEKGFFSITGAVLEPFLGVSENTRNAICCFGIGFLVGILLLGIESLKGKSPSIKRLLLRPTIGGMSAMILFIVILSGGALIWNEVNGVKGLSLGLIAVIGALFCEKFEGLVGASA